ncbi:putative tail tape measure protein [Enterobacteria phage vB_EcoS_IME167]|uniref:Tape measure protein n=3 Tax=Tunavirus JMPW1 TaxID=2049887 RepID=A0A0U3ED77_9CAUD|nr:tail length tape measure protein [Escherichia phage JMPW1]ALT58244.1 putative tail tape measure protein [Escherichia phage JMPW1]AWD90973.1 putative tail tape measure protein [Enterobacteria phage vB_EcoS_IME167]QXY00793.1 putative tail tape measure protein [Escherichia phage phi2013]
MVDKVAGLSLDVDVSTVQRAVKSLKEFSKANDQAADSMGSLINESEVAKQKAKEHAEQLRRQRKEYEAVEKAIDPTVSKMERLKIASQQLDKLWQQGVVPDETFFRLGEMLDLQNAKLARSRAMLTEEGQAALQEAKAKEQAAARSKAFMDALNGQVNAIGKTHAELMELKAAELGLSKEAAPLIAKLKDQGRAMNAAGISAGEYRQAMRMLPAQITDVVTSLASGMPVWMVAIQQGGQIKDSFGGIGNTFKVLLSYINPVTAGIGVLVGSLGLLAKAGYDSYKSITDIQNALIETGGYAGVTAEDLDSVSKKIAQTSNSTIGSIREIVTELASSGKYTREQIQNITKATAEWSASTGKSASQIISEFDKIASDPVKGLKKLNEQYNFLEKGQLTYIDTLSRTKGETEAVSEATKLFADVMEKRMKSIADNATPLEKMWNDIKQWASDAWGWVGDHTLGALNLIIDVVQGTVIQVKMILAKGDEYISNFIASAIKATQSLPGMSDFGADVLKEQENIVKSSRDNYDQLSSELDAINARVEKGEMGYIEAMRQRRTLEKQYSEETKEAIRKEAEEIEKRNRERNKQSKIVRSPTEQFDKELISLKAQLKVLQEHKEIGQKLSAQRKALFTTEATIAVLREASSKRQLSAEEKALLASQERVIELAKQKAEIGDQIVKQQQLNDLTDKSLKFVNEMTAATEQLNASRGLSTREMERQAELAKITTDYINSGGSEGDEKLQNMIKAQNDYYAAEDAKRADWLAGAESAFADYGDAAMDMYGNVNDIASSALNGMSDMMVQFLTTGKANFEDFAKNIIGMIIKMIAQMVIFNTISGMMGGKTWSFAGGASSGASAASQATPTPAASVFRSASSGGAAVSLAAAAGSVATSGFNASNSAPKAINHSGGGTVVDVSGMEVRVDNGSDPRGISQGVEMMFKKMIRESCSQGGEVYNYIQEKTGG